MLHMCYRYYEGCVVRMGKDGLSFKYVVITERSVLLADHPLREIYEVVRLADVTSITLVSGTDQHLF
jgi:hypothetical protein